MTQDRLNLRQRAQASVSRGPSARLEVSPEVDLFRLALAGKFHIQHWRDGQIIDEFDVKNGITDEGIEALLDAGFGGGTQITAWYVGLVNASGWTAFAAGDTMGSHAGWTELTTYDEATRPEWAPDPASSRSITNPATVDFSINGSASAKGIFIVADDTKGGNTDVLWSTAAFASNQTLQNGDTLKITYALSG